MKAGVGSTSCAGESTFESKSTVFFVFEGVVRGGVVRIFADVSLSTSSDRLLRGDSADASFSLLRRNLSYVLYLAAVYQEVLVRFPIE